MKRRAELEEEEEERRGSWTRYSREQPEVVVIVEGRGGEHVAASGYGDRAYEA